MTTDATPDQFFVGDSVSWTHKEADYSSSDGWTAEYVFVSSSRQQIIPGIAQADGSWLFTITAAESAKWDAGNYAWQRSVSLAAERYTVGTGRTVVNVNYADQSIGIDYRHQYERIIDAIDDTLQGRVNHDVNRYTFNGRSLDKLTVAELMQARGYYKTLLNDYLRSTGQGGRSRIIRTVL